MNLSKYIMDHKVAAGWNELQPKQFARIAHALATLQGVTLKATIAWILLDLNWRKPRVLCGFLFGLTAEGRHRITELADPFLSPKGLVDTLLPTLTAGRTTLHLHCKDLLNDVDVETWGIADAFFMRYNKTKHVQWLWHMAAVLYVQAGTPRAKRLAPTSLALYERVPVGQLNAMHLMWAGQRLVLVDESPEPFRSTNQKKAERRKGGWGDVMLSMAGGKFGSLKNTKRESARVFLRELHNAMVLDKEREAKAKRKR